MLIGKQVRHQIMGMEHREMGWGLGFGIFLWFFGTKIS
jgi:hypothetical protein